MRRDLKQVRQSGAMGHGHVFHRRALGACLEPLFHAPGIDFRSLQNGLDRGEAATIGWAGILAQARATS